MQVRKRPFSLGASLGESSHAVFGRLYWTKVHNFGRLYLTIVQLDVNIVLVDLLGVNLLNYIDVSMDVCTKFGRLY